MHPLPVTTTTTSPFPWSALRTFTRSDVQLIKHVTTALWPTVSWAQRQHILGPPWEKLLGGTLDIVTHPPRVVTTESVFQQYDSTTLTAVFRNGSRGYFSVVFDRPWAMTVAHRALGGDHSAVLSLSDFTPAHEGAMMMLCAQTAQHLFGPTQSIVVRAVTENLAFALERMNSPTLIAWNWSVKVGQFRSECSVLLPAQWYQQPPHHLVEQLESIANFPGKSLPIGVDLVCLRGTSSIQDLMELQINDIWISENPNDLTWTTPTGLSGQGAIIHGDLEIPCNFTNTIATITAPAVQTTSHRSSSEYSNNSTEPSNLSVLFTASVQVTVRLAQHEFSLQQIQQWRVGDAVTFPVELSPGKSLALFAAGRPVAHGHLCEINGQVGLKITKLGAL